MEAEERYNVAAQLERTVLAWNRAALAIGANGALIVHEAFQRDLAPITVGGLVVVAIGLSIWGASIGRYSSALDRNASHLISDRHQVVLAAACFAAMLSIGDLILIVATP